jgi:DNA polymerase-3 subunit delta
LAKETEEAKDTLIVLLPEVGAFDMGTPKRPSAMYKKLTAFLEIVSFPKSTDSQLINWLGRHFAHEGVGVTPDALRELPERCGHGMDVLAEETKKLAAYAKANHIETVTVELVRHVSCPSTEEDAFGLTNALMAMDAKGAFENLADLRARRVEPTILLSQIARFITDMLSVGLLAEGGQTAAQIAASLKLNEYKVKLYMKASRQHSTARLRRDVRLCKEADAQVKLSYGVDAYAAIERLVATLLA